jgi:hypothetical protein
MPVTGAETAFDELLRSGLFDAQFYFDEYPDARQSGVGPLEHYCDRGWKEGRKPNPYFDGVWYMSRYPDVATAGVNPLLHYVRHGDREGRCPRPEFDPSWYRSAYQVPEDDWALLHFLARRFGGGVIPSPHLYAVPRLPPYCHEAAVGLDPFIHYLDDVANGKLSSSLEVDLIRQSGLVDASFYLINAGDVHAAAAEPVGHFCHWGWQELRKPNIYFDTGWYLGTNPDIRRMGINPLVHYLLEGEKAGRRPVVYFDPVWYREVHSVPLEKNALAHYLAHRRTQAVSPNPLFDVRWYVANYGRQIGPGRDAFAHYLQVGTFEDLDPSPAFNASEYRRLHLGRPSRRFRHLARLETHNPLVHALTRLYR